MREIKFRAWDNESREWWRELILVRALDGKCMTEFESYEPAKECDFILSQYTGLKDKNGTEIYEGDIVKLPGDSFNRDWQVIWLKCGFWLEPITKIRNWGDWLCNKHGLEVIGNIYENPELVRKAKDD